ncbi:MAG: hypothetical protein JWQ49_854 [Edaphobacter sp.]|nr:hypothetical protein [Edaphobacter sp.]
MVVHSYFSLAEQRRKSSTRVASALISPKTAKSLLRALQSIRTCHDYKIPDEEDDLEINEKGYDLKGWLQNFSGDKKLDEGDDFRRDAGPRSYRPGTDVSRVLGLCIDSTAPFRWHAANTVDAFRYLEWSDDLEKDQERYDSESVRSSGFRLIAKRSCVLEYLKAKGRDLIVEVTIEKRIEKNGYSEEYEESTNEVTFDQVFVLRQDGTIETASESLGTWTTDIQRA